MNNTGIKTGGRVKGKKNLKTVDLRDTINNFVAHNFKAAQATYDTMPAKEKLLMRTHQQKKAGFFRGNTTTNMLLFNVADMVVLVNTQLKVGIVISIDQDIDVAVIVIVAPRYRRVGKAS